MEMVLIQEATVASVEQGPYTPVMADIQDLGQLDRESKAIMLDTIASIARAVGDRTSLYNGIPCEQASNSSLTETILE